MALAGEILEHHQYACAVFGGEPLLVDPDGHVLDLATSYIPLLSTFTTEDKAAKGLRKGKETQSQPEYFSLLELVRDNQVLLLSGPIGSGKSTFAKQLCYGLATQDQTRSDAAISGETIVESGRWDANGLQPCYFVIKDALDLEVLARDTAPTLLDSLPKSTQTGLVLVIDAIENADETAAKHIENIATQILACGNHRQRLLILSDSKASNDLILPPSVTKYSIKPLSVEQRREKIAQLTGADPSTIDYALGDAAANPALFALAFEAKHRDDKPEALIDAWLVNVAGTEQIANDIAEKAFHQTCQEIRYVPRPKQTSQQVIAPSPQLASLRKIRYLLAARHLSTLPVDNVIEFFQHNPVATAETIESILTRLAPSPEFDDLASTLLQSGDLISQRAALLLSKSGHIPIDFQGQICRQALVIIAGGQLPVTERQEAARILSRSGDPRDLTALADVPTGTITLGSNTHPNSQPTHQVLIDAFRIGVYPITVQQYMAFATSTDRHWVSPDAHDPDRQNFPATDVTWHDAVAYCKWLTTCWRADGRIAADEEVRLPSEPEWEKAASGGQNAHDLAECLYPWGTEWHPDTSNCEETGLNQPCAVGLFPRGQSLYGCHDMAGNIWEWCTTLWGEDMASPSFGYPWQDDEREALEARPSVRRVLRGGCFSSGRLKANCTYRGSLEPTGYWRGNGFRIVVAKCD